MNDLAFPIRVRPDLIIRVIGLPHDLTKEEAERIAKIIIAYAVVDVNQQIGKI